MSSSGRQHHDVARRERDLGPAGAAEQHAGTAGDDAEDLVRIAVEMMEREDPVAPGAHPAVACEQLLAGLGRVDDRVDPAAKDNREIWVVGDSGVDAEVQELGAH